MSEKTTLAEVSEEIMIAVDDGRVILCGNIPIEISRVSGVNVSLTADVLDAIARLHSERKFPHQATNREPVSVSTATQIVLGGVGAMSPELFAKARARIAELANADVDSDEFQSGFSRALRELPCPLD